MLFFLQYKPICEIVDINTLDIVVNKVFFYQKRRILTKIPVVFYSKVSFTNKIILKVSVF